MNSCGCFTVVIILAIFWLIFLAPSIAIGLDATLSLILSISILIPLFIAALCFITRSSDDSNDYDSGIEQAKVTEHERILVVCPYCGAKNDQGVPSCANCGAEL
ncbi:MAG: zinc ribbon domain-containing protein [Candidatus Thorarchaeota archaeon]